MLERKYYSTEIIFLKTGISIIIKKLMSSFYADFT